MIIAARSDVVEPAHTQGTSEARRRQGRRPKEISFFLHIARFEWVGDVVQLGPKLGQLAAVAERLGFDGVSVMDHLIQIPQVGRAWEKMPESLTTIAYPGRDYHATSSLADGGQRHPPTARLAGQDNRYPRCSLWGPGRMRAGSALVREQAAYGIEFGSSRRRLDVLESFRGKVLEVPEAACYPRPVQDHIPVIVGGRGNRTLRLASELADGCNLLTSNLDEDLARLHQQLRQAGRQSNEFLITVLDVTVCGTDRCEVAAIVELVRGNQPAARVGKRPRAGTVDEHIGRYRQLAELGVERVYDGLADLAGPETVERFAPVVAAFA